MSDTSNNEYESDDSAVSESEIANENAEIEYRQLKKQQNKQKIKSNKMTKVVKSSDPSIQVELKSRVKKKQPRKIVIYREDLEDQDEEFEIIEKKPKGRPKAKKIVKYKNKKGEEVDDRLDADEVVINTAEKKQLSEKDIQILKLEERLAELETVSGKRIRGTKKNKPDKRQINQRSEKQIAAAERLVAANKERARLRREAKLKTETKETVNEVIKELGQKKQEEKTKKEEIKQAVKAAYDPLKDPYL